MHPTVGRLAMTATAVLATVVVPGCERHVEAFPHVTVFVDTDTSVPLLASQLRIDVFDESGRWRETKQVALRDESDFPASFSVLRSTDDTGRVAFVRLRLSPDGAQRDYRGERYRAPSGDDASPESVVAIPAGDGEPRLVEDGVDRTPPFEPLPELTIDRLVQLDVGRSSRRRVVLHAACAGRMADIAKNATCIDETTPWGDADEGDAEVGQASLVGGFARRFEVPIDAPPRDDRVPIRGGVFTLGTSDLPIATATGEIVPSFPPRLAAMTSFVIDRTEVSVARARAAVARGFAPKLEIRDNPNSLAKSANDSSDAQCTYSAEPDSKDVERDSMPVTCVPFETARAFCRFEGGDLPSEAQWEYAASASNRPRKSRYPWGEAPPTCSGVVYARFDDRSRGGDDSCFREGFPFGMRGAADAVQDVTPDGVRGLAGTAYEWVLGAPLPYDSACFQRAGIVDPRCEVSGAKRSVRGASFSDPASSLVTTGRGSIPANGNTPLGGFRCVYPP